MEPISVIVSIVERGRGVAIEKLYSAHRASLHLQCSGRGTATSEIMDILGLGSSEKDVVLSFATRSCAAHLLSELDSDLRGKTGSSGIVFSLALSGLNSLTAAAIGFHSEGTKREKGGNAPMEHTENSLILVACSRGSADDIMSTAKEHGARGGTVIKARLAGLELLEEAYDTELTAEREIVAIVVPTDRRAPIMEAVNARHGLRSPAQGVLCSLPIEQIVRLG